MVHVAAARLVLAALLFLTLLPPPLSAQETLAQDPAATPALPADLRGVDVDALMARLPDEQVRALLLEELRREAARETAATGAGMVDSVDASGARLKELARETVASLGDIPRTVADAYRQLTTGPGLGSGMTRILAILVGVAILIGAGLAVEAWYGRRTAEIRARIADAPAGSTAVRIGRGLLRSFLDLLSIVAFALPVIVLFVVIEPPNETVRMVVAAYLVALIFVRLAGVVSRIVFAPYAPALRLAPLGDTDAQYLHAKVLQVAIVWAFGHTTCELMYRLGLSDPAHHLMVVVVGLLIALLFIVAIWHFRQPVARAFKGRDYNHDDLSANPPGLRLRAQVADLWHVLASAYMALAWAIWGLATLLDSPAVSGGAGESMMLVFLLPVASYGIRSLLVAFLGDDDAAAGAPSYVDAVMRGVNVLLVILTLAMIWAAWGGSMHASAASTVGETAAQAAFDIILTLVMADVLWKLIRTAIDRRLRAEGIDPDAEAAALPGAGGEGGGSGGGSRVATLLPLFRKTAAVTLVVIVAMTVLSSLGVDIGPILAGAGVVGLAIGFGAQTLVRDIVSGVFFLIDDAFRVGEYIDVGEAKGTVENISIRSIRLRHHRGPLNTIPFGEIKKVQNLSRDWVIMKLEFRVPYDTDVAQVKKIIKRIGAELLEDEEVGPNFLEPLKSQGVYAMEDSVMVIKVKFMAKPGEQFVIRREAYQRIRAAFEAAGIPFAHRIVTVKSAADDEAAGGGAAAAAVAAAAEQDKAAQPA